MSKRDSSANSRKQLELENLLKKVSEVEKKYKAAVQEKEKIESDKAQTENLIKEREIQTEKITQECEKLRTGIESLQKIVKEKEIKLEELKLENQELTAKNKGKLEPTVFKPQLNELEIQLSQKNLEFDEMYFFVQCKK